MTQDFNLWFNDITHRFAPTSLDDVLNGSLYTATAIVSAVTTNSSFKMSMFDAYFDLRCKLLDLSEIDCISILPQCTTIELAALTGTLTGQMARNITVGRNEVFDGTDWKNASRRSSVTGITASITQTQGSGELTGDINVISTVANNNDVVTLPTAEAGDTIIVYNNGSKKVKIFPNTSDDLGEGVDSSVSLSAGSVIIFHCFDATNWIST